MPFVIVRVVVVVRASLASAFTRLGGAERLNAVQDRALILVMVLHLGEILGSPRLMARAPCPEIIDVNLRVVHFNDVFHALRDLGHGDHDDKNEYGEVAAR